MEETVTFHAASNMTRKVVCFCLKIKNICSLSQLLFSEFRSPVMFQSYPVSSVASQTQRIVITNHIMLCSASNKRRTILLAFKQRLTSTSQLSLVFKDIPPFFLRCMHVSPKRDDSDVLVLNSRNLRTIDYIFFKLCSARSQSCTGWCTFQTSYPLWVVPLTRINSLDKTKHMCKSS